MPSFVYNTYKLKNALGQFSLSANDFYMALLTSSYPGFSAGTSATAEDTHSFYSDVSAYECPATGNYVTNGQVLSAVTVTLDTSANAVIWDCVDLTWSNSTIDSNGCVIYKNNTNKDLILCYDFNSVKSTSNSDFIIQVNSLGLLNIISS